MRRMGKDVGFGQNGTIRGDDGRGTHLAYFQGLANGVLLQ